MSSTGEPTSRAERARIQYERAATSARLEAAEAQKLIDAFVAEADRRGLAPEVLRVQLSGGGTAKTDKSGWYIKVNKSVAIGIDKKYYVLTVPGGLRERLIGVRLEPAQPSLTVSKGGRDGESGDLRQFLAWTLGCRP